jgi:thymidylate synthase (FAD)
MKLIKPSYQIIKPTGYTIDDIYKSIELVGRVSHKSEDKITENSAKTFVKRMIKLGHGATLEHGTIYLSIPYNFIHRITNIGLCSKYIKNPYSKCFIYYDIAKTSLNFRSEFGSQITKYLAVTTNLRVLIENNWLDDLKYLCEPTKFHEKRYTVKFICDRAIANEFVRHRKFSFLQESTRYCNYSKDKFNNELTFIKPYWIEYLGEINANTELCFLSNQYNREDPNLRFLASLANSKHNYLALLNKGWKSEQARNILPLCLKTELYMTGFESDWDQFFRLRTASNAHPQSRELTIPLKEEFIKERYIIE